MRLNCITVDDEPLALGLLNSFVAQTPFLNLAASFSSALEAAKTLEKGNIHLVFLDIQMPKLSGIEIARLLSTQGHVEPARVIFTTAYHQFAVESYRVDALDYLLKPFEYEDFLQAAHKALKYYNSIKPVPKTGIQEECIFVRSAYHTIKIMWDDIRYIEGLKDYVKIHLISSDKPILTLATLKSLTEKLPKHKFIRVQRSFIVATDKITATSKSSIWLDDLEITLGEQYKAAIQDLFNKWL